LKDKRRRNNEKREKRRKKEEVAFEPVRSPDQKIS
jgi:hypothetical protein